MTEKRFQKDAAVRESDRGCQGFGNGAAERKPRDLSRSRWRRMALLVLALTALGAVPAAPASASVIAILQDCQDDKIDGTYTQKDYANALRSVATDTSQYSDCRDIISRARLASAAAANLGAGANSRAGAAVGGAVSGGTGGGTPGSPGAPGAAGTGNAGKSADQVLEAASPAERSQVAQARTGSAAVQVGGSRVSPATSGLSPAGAANIVPTPLKVALILLAVGLVASAAHHVRSRVLTRRPAAP